MVASGGPFRINPEVNVPEGIEKSGSQQEENKPNVGASKNRLLLSQVAYFQNYQMKTDKDRKGHDEEQKYRDRKNKLMSQVAYYLGCRHKTEVPGFLLSASNISKVASGRPPYRKYTEVNVPESIEKSCSQQENNKPNVRVSKNRCLLSEANYSLNCRLKTYNDQKDHDEEQKCRDSKNKHLRSQAAYYLDCRLKTEESQGDVEEEEEKGPVPPRNLQESVEEEAPQESWDEGDSTLSVPPGPSAFNETLRSNLHSLEEQQVISAVDIDKIKNDQEEEEDQGPPCPRLSMELVEAEEPEVFRSSLDVLYSTYAAYPEFYFTCQAYTYVTFLFVEERVRLTLDMDSRFLTMTVTRLLPLVSRVGVIFPH
uniref:neuroblastoma breakpoint family member 3-like isoform X2 n=1 Tax=Callithrix jacchus TaxID=9483 RepID=UPI0023DD5CFB|nr:neuroblastoma breakpoint family member 3-like isoform X2 [Callithrix jacchus]